MCGRNKQNALSIILLFTWCNMVTLVNSSMVIFKKRIAWILPACPFFVHGEPGFCQVLHFLLMHSLEKPSVSFFRQRMAWENPDTMLMANGRCGQFYNLRF